MEDQKYWMSVLSKLNAAHDIDIVTQGVLKDLCGNFGFGIGFIYEADYKGNYHLAKTYKAYAFDLPEVIHGGSTFSTEEEINFLTKECLYFREDTEKNEIHKKIQKLFNAKSMAVVHITDPKDGIISIVGLMDRRGKNRHDEADVVFIGAMLMTVGTYVRMKMYQKHIQTSQKALERILDHMGIDVYVNDFENHEILYLNQSMAAPYGTVDEMIGRTCWKALYDDKTEECDFCPRKQLIDEDGNPTKIYGWDYRRPFDGSWFRVLSAAFPWTDGRMAQVVSSVDITENKRNEEIIRMMAEYDMLTSLPNRAKLTADLEKMVDENEKIQGECYVVFFDLNGFKQANDTYGHLIGDDLLVAIAEFLQSDDLTKDRCYRYGGDEFVILLDDAHKDELDAMLALMKARFSKLWSIGGNEIRCGASIGISHCPSDAVEASKLLRAADQAMYESKIERKGEAFMYNKGNPTLRA